MALEAMAHKSMLLLWTFEPRNLLQVAGAQTSELDKTRRDTWPQLVSRQLGLKVARRPRLFYLLICYVTEVKLVGGTWPVLENGQEGEEKQLLSCECGNRSQNPSHAQARTQAGPMEIFV